VTVIGPCASGKTTLVERLKAAGYDAWVTSQEHSGVPDLWNHQRPDAVIGLRTDLETIRRRRGAGWSKVIFEAQMERLQRAYGASGIIVDTSVSSEDETLDASLTYLESIGERRRQ
jgi:deoxyadenosine/deoxycytidine kinase